MNSRRIASSWNNRRDLEYFDDSEARGEKVEECTNKLRGKSIPRNSSITVNSSRPHRRQAETLVGKSIQLNYGNTDSYDDDEEEEHKGKDNNEGISFRDKRLLLARKRMEASSVSTNGVTLGVGGYTTHEYSKRSSSVSRVDDGHAPSKSILRPSSVSRLHGDVTRTKNQNLGVHDSSTANNNSNKQTAASTLTSTPDMYHTTTRTNVPSRRMSSRVINTSTTIQTDFVEVALETMSLKATPIMSKSPPSEAAATSSLVSPLNNDDVSSLGSTGSDAFSSRQWLPPKLKTSMQQLSPTSLSSSSLADSTTTRDVTLKQKIPYILPEHHYHSRSPDSLRDNTLHPPKYVSASTSSKPDKKQTKGVVAASSLSYHQDVIPSSSKESENLVLIVDKYTNQESSCTTNINQENNTTQLSTRRNDETSISSNTPIQSLSDLLSFERAQKAKALRRSRLAYSNSTDPSSSYNGVADENRILNISSTKEDNFIMSNSTTATVTTTSTSMGSVPSFINQSKTLSSTRPDTVVMTNTPLMETTCPPTMNNYLDMEDERSIKSSVTTFTYLSNVSENANTQSGHAQNINNSLQHSRANRLRRRKIALIYHVLTCTHPPPLLTKSSTTNNPSALVSEEYVPCPQLKCCYALSILIRHAQTCTFVSKDGHECCDVPCCADYKKAWLHFRRCALARSTGKRQFCLLCSEASFSKSLGENNHPISDTFSASSL